MRAQARLHDKHVPMTSPPSAAHLSTLPVKVRTLLQRALAAEGEGREKLVDRALEAAGFEYGPTLPLAETLTPMQRSIAELLALEDIVITNHGMPAYAEGRRRWLGLGPEEPGLLERTPRHREAHG